jgi:hypothetical protein
VHNVSDVRQTGAHTAEPIVLGLILLQVEIATATFKKYKTLGND